MVKFIKIYLDVFELLFMMKVSKILVNFLFLLRIGICVFWFCFNLLLLLLLQFVFLFVFYLQVKILILIFLLYCVNVYCCILLLEYVMIKCDKFLRILCIIVLFLFNYLVRFKRLFEIVDLYFGQLCLYCCYLICYKDIL